MTKDEAAAALQTLAAQTSPRSPPRAPQDCGHFDIHIDRDGNWFYRGSPIKRAALVRLFSTVLERDDSGAYWLRTPAERGRISVEDAPFVAVAIERRGEGRSQSLILRTNVDDTVAIGPEHPLTIVTDPTTRTPRPYVEVRNGLAARLARPVFYELVELGCEERVGDETQFGVWSEGKFFQLGMIGDAL